MADRHDDCEQTERTLAWVYGELPDAEDAAHLAHVGACAVCQAVVAEHESVGALLAGVAAHQPLDTPVHTGGSWFRPALALAAAAVLVVAGALWMSSGSGDLGPPAPVASAPVPGPVPADPVADLPPPVLGFASDLDADLDDLDADLDSLLVDLSALDEPDDLEDLDDFAPLEAP